MTDIDIKTASTRDELCRALCAAEANEPNGVKAQTLRLIHCAMADRDIVARGRGECSGCEETDIHALLKTMVAQREISAKEYDDAGRIADAERERLEIDVIQAFLPQPLKGDALKDAVRQVVEDLSAGKLKDVGRCMSVLRERYPGQIDCSSVGKAVKAALS